MDTTLKLALETHIKSKTGFAFEAFIKTLHLEQYGADGFTPTREVKDKGSDGIVKNPPKVIASYGPATYKKKDFEKKADEDFSMYVQHWVANYPNWAMFYNNTLSPDQIQKIDELKKAAVENGHSVADATILGIDQIMNIIESGLKNKQVRKIAEHLNIPKELITKDYIKEIVTDLMSGLGIQDENVEYSLKVNIDEKIVLNYTNEEIEDAKREYEHLAVSGALQDINGILSIYEDEEINAFKLRVIKDFGSVSGSFKQKLDNLTDSYLQKYSNEQDDDYRYYIRAVLIYCFEQCIIGTKTKQELV